MQLEHKSNEQKQQQPATLRSHAKCASANITGGGGVGVLCVYVFMFTHRTAAQARFQPSLGETSS